MEIKHLKFLALLLIISPCLVASVFVTEVTETMFIAQSWSNITNMFTEGSTKGFLSFQEIQNYISQIRRSFPNLVLEVESIGKTVEERHIKAIHLGLKKPGSSKDDHNKTESEQKPRILFTGYLRGNDFMSTAMLIHLTNYLIYESLHNNPNIKYLLENRDIWIIPLINADAYNFVSNYFDEHNRTTVITKNRRKNDHKNICEKFAIGIDLNRNFDIFFDHLDILPRQFGDYTESEDYICKPFYRGPKPFSEPETVAIREFLNKKQFQMAINFVERGNMFLTPNNYDTSLENSALKEKVIYKSIEDECPFPAGIKFGTRYQVLEETNHGEISDYMLNKKHIIAGSYALGVGDIGYEEYLPTPTKAKRILKDNLDAVLYFIYKVGVLYRIEELFQGRCNSDLPECPESDMTSYLFRLRVSNTGLKDSAEKTSLQISFQSKDVYDLQQVTLTVSGMSALAGLGINLEDSKVTYQIEIPPLGIGEHVEVSPVIIKSTSSSDDSVISVSQIMIVKVQDYPKTKLSHYEANILEPNFDLEEAKEQTHRRNMIITIGLIIVSCWVTFGGGYAVLKHFRGKGKSQPKFRKLKDDSVRDVESPSKVIDQDGDTSIRQRGPEQEPEERITRKNKKSKSSKEGSKSKSKSKSKSGSRSKDEKKKKKEPESPKSKPKKISKPKENPK